MNNHYLLIESRDAFVDTETREFMQLGCELAHAGAQVTLCLVENGVFAAREAAKLPELAELARAGVMIVADEFALRERGIVTEEIDARVKAVGLEAIIGALGAGAKALWH